MKMKFSLTEEFLFDSFQIILIMNKTKISMNKKSHNEHKMLKSHNTNDQLVL